MDIGTNGDGSMRGGKLSGTGMIWGNGGSLVTMVNPPVPPKGAGLGINTGDGDLLLIVLL